MYEEVLIEWNFWGDFDINYIERDINTAELLSENYALVLFGIRRAGKSYIAYGSLKKAIEKGLDEKETLILNFEDPRLKNIDAKDCLKILEIYFKLTNAKNPIIVLDEVQNVRAWETFVRYLIENKRFRVIVTGSSSKLMSKEYATVLTGRHVDIEIFPLNFMEFLRFKGIKIKNEVDIYKNKIRILRTLDEYLEWGGFPEIALLDSKLKRSELLRKYFDDILTKDISERFGIRDKRFLESLANVYLANISNIVRFRKLSREFNKSIATVERYSYYFETARLFHFLNKISYKVKEVEKSLKKVYVADVAFHTRLALKFSKNIGKVMENIVFLELARKYRINKELFYYVTKSGKEIDFAMRENQRIKALVEVCYEDDFESHGKKLAEAGKELRCKNLLCITWDYEDEIEFKGKKIRFMPLWKWLLMG